MPVVGFLNSTSSLIASSHLGGFRQGLNEVGYVEGHNVAIEYRWAEGRYDRLPALAADLVRRRVNGDRGRRPSGQSRCKDRNNQDPDRLYHWRRSGKVGLVASLSRPGGNVTGISFIRVELSAKRLGFLHELVPGATAIAACSIQASRMPNCRAMTCKRLPARWDFKLRSRMPETRRRYATLAKFSEQRLDALIVASDPAYMARREQIVALTKRYAIPTLYELRDYVDAGGLMSYGTSIRDGYRLAGAMSAAFSRARSQPTYRSCRRPNSSWSSISGPLGRSVSNF